MNPDALPRNVQESVYATNLEHLRTYGFTIDPSLPRWERLAKTILQINAGQWFSRLQQTSFHDLCIRLKPPPGSRLLLGLGEKFCLERGQPRGIDYKFLHNFERLKRSIRLNDYFRRHTNDRSDNNSWEPDLYIPSDFDPPPASGNLELQMMAYGNRLERAVKHASLRRRKRS